MGSVEELVGETSLCQEEEGRGGGRRDQNFMTESIRAMVFAKNDEDGIECAKDREPREGGDEEDRTAEQDLLERSGDGSGSGVKNLDLPDLSELLPYQPVPVIDMERFLGRWYEIARIPNRWQSRGNLTTVHYLKHPKTGRLRIHSRTYIEGRKHDQSGRLWVLDPLKNSEYKVQFCWPFTGAFWILHAGDTEDYGYSVIGDPIKCNLWILSRQPVMETFLYEKLVAQLEWQGYDVSKLEETIQSTDLDHYDEDPVFQ